MSNTEHTSSFRIYYGDGNQRILETTSIEKLFIYLSELPDCEDIIKVVKIEDKE